LRQYSLQFTGLSRLSLTGIGNGFNVSRNLSFDEDVARLCGLTRKDIETALKNVCSSDEAEEHLSVLERISFLRPKKGRNQCPSYLQVETDAFQPRSCLQFADAHGRDCGPSSKGRNAKFNTPQTPRSVKNF
jgi:Predicted AAA-ATPase